MNHIEEAAMILSTQIERRTELNEFKDIVDDLVQLILTHDEDDELYKEWFSEVVLSVKNLISFEEFYKKTYENGKVTNDDFLGLLKYKYTVLN